MANRRMISKSISTSRKLAKVSQVEALLFIMIIPHCDDYGRMDATPTMVKGIVIPIRPETVEEVGKALDSLEKIGLIKRYEVDGEQYLQIEKWEEHQTFRSDRPRIPKYPSPLGVKEVDQENPSLLAEVYRRDGYKCRYCGAEDTNFEVDHILPISMGGKDALENMVVACRKCNQKKRDRTPEEAGMTLVVPKTYQRRLSSKQVKGREVKVSKDNTYSIEFEKWWGVYPRKISKVDAYKAWNRVKPDEKMQKQIMEALANHIESDQWTRDEGRYIPHPTTWLNQRRFESMLPKPKPKEKKAYYMGDPIFLKFGKRYVRTKDGRELEFAGKEKDIEYR